MGISSTAWFCSPGAATGDSSSGRLQLPLAAPGPHHGLSLELPGKRCVQPTEQEAAGDHLCLEDGEEEENVHSLCSG